LLLELVRLWLECKIYIVIGKKITGVTFLSYNLYFVIPVLVFLLYNILKQSKFSTTNNNGCSVYVLKHIFCYIHRDTKLGPWAIALATLNQPFKISKVSLDWWRVNKIKGGLILTHYCQYKDLCVTNQLKFILNIIFTLFITKLYNFQIYKNPWLIES